MRKDGVSQDAGGCPRLLVGLAVRETRQDSLNGSHKTCSKQLEKTL